MEEGPDPGLRLQCLPQRDRRRGDGPSEGGQLRGGGHSRREVRQAVKLFVVARDPSLSVEELKAYCKENLTGYKIPRRLCSRMHYR
ncbi:hypothetical protein P4233_29520 [Pseudomonas aeruginosa]|nr:hypothetical protein [Pseudomonas aeruginosa]